MAGPNCHLKISNTTDTMIHDDDCSLKTGGQTCFCLNLEHSPPADKTFETWFNTTPTEKGRHEKYFLHMLFEYFHAMHQMGGDLLVAHHFVEWAEVRGYHIDRTPEGEFLNTRLQRIWVIVQDMFRFFREPS